MEVTKVGPFHLADARTADVIAWAGLAPLSRRVAFAVHVGGLNASEDVDFVSAVNSGDLVYADGASVVLLAKMGGARQIQRAATTDVGVPMIESVAETLRRSPRVAIVGGPPGIAAAAGKELERQCQATVVLALHGYFEDSEAVLRSIAEAAPDIVIVGLGMPREALWVRDNLDQMPNALILTCGGWLGFLAGNESRAPQLLQSLGLEWAYRLAQAPGRLRRRYFTGMLTVGRLSRAQIAHRLHRATDAYAPEGVIR